MSFAHHQFDAHPTTDATALSWERVQPTLTTTDANTPGFLSTSPSASDLVYWNGVIDEKLIEWGRNPAPFEVEGMDAPSPQSIRRTLELVQLVRDQAAVSRIRPDSIVPDGDGGVLIEYELPSMTQQMVIDRDGGIEIRLFRGSSLIERRFVLPG